MRQLIIAVLALLALVPCAEAGRKAKLAGEIVDGKYVDSEYGFSLKFHDNWSTSISKHDSKMRVAFAQKNYGIPPHYTNVPDYTKVPRLTVFVDTSSLNIHVMLDSLLADGYQSDQKKEIVKAFEFLQRSDIIVGDIQPRGRSRIEVGGESGALWKGRLEYKQVVQSSTSSASGSLKADAYGGAIMGVKHGKYMILMHLMCEFQFFDQIMVEAQQIMQSLEFVDAETDEKSQKSE